MMVDFASAVAAFVWPDEFGRRAAHQILGHRQAGPMVVGHADWYAGNTAVVDGELVGVFD